MNVESVMTDILKTIENYSNGALLKDRDRLTSRYADFRLKQLEKEPIIGQFDINHLKSIHYHLFQDLPKLGFDEKPGVFRNEVRENQTWIKNRYLSDGSAYKVVYSKMDKQALNRLDTLLKEANPAVLSKLNDKEFAEAISKIYVGCDQIHPFYDGNSRTLRTFTQQLADESGHHLRWEKFDQIQNGRDSLYISRDKSVAELSLKLMEGIGEDKSYEALKQTSHQLSNVVLLEKKMTNIINKKLEPIRRIDFQDLQKNEIQDNVIRAVQANPEQFINRFIQHPVSFGGRFISSDSFKETFEQYNQSNETRNFCNKLVHNAASVLASEQLRRVLQEPKELRRDTVVLLSGIPGAGKTSTVLNKGKLSDGIHAVYEGQLSDEKNAITKVQQVIDAGFKPVIIVVHSTPEYALDNTLRRFTEIGRGASIDVMAKIQGGLPDGLNAVKEKFGDEVRLDIVDKRDLNNVKKIRGWNNLNILQSEGNHENIKQRLEQHLESRKSSIEPEAYRQSAGLSPVGYVGRYGEIMQRNDSRPSITQENRHDVGLKGNIVDSNNSGKSVSVSAETDKTLNQNLDSKKQVVSNSVEVNQNKNTVVLDADEVMLPRTIRNNYHVHQGKFFDKTNKDRLVFEDKGLKLVTATNEKLVIADMIRLAANKNWKELKLTGTNEFKREAWLEAESQGIKTDGYKPNDADLAALNSLRTQRSVNQIQPIAQDKPAVNKSNRNDINTNYAVILDEATKKLPENINWVRENYSDLNNNQQASLALARGIEQQKSTEHLEKFDISIQNKVIRQQYIEQYIETQPIEQPEKEKTQDYGHEYE
jgi:fido (protein-threonine AMPylation protein)